MNALERIGEHLSAVARAEGQLYFEPGPRVCEQPARAGFDWWCWPLDPARIDLLAADGVPAPVRGTLKVFTAALQQALDRHRRHGRSPRVTDFIVHDAWYPMFDAANAALALLYPPRD